MAYRLGIDVGGTFTDLLLFNDETGEMFLTKTASTPSDQSIGVLIGIRKIASLGGLDPGEIKLILHGTTVVALSTGGEPKLVRETRIGYYPVKAPSVDVRSVGAGGGSIAHVPLTGALRVGPKLSHTSGRTEWIGPSLGAHNEEIYIGRLGLTRDEFSQLCEEGII